MLQLTNASIAIAAQKPSNGSCVLAMVDCKVLARCGVVGATDGAPTVLCREHSGILSGRHAVAFLSLIFHVAQRIFVIPLHLFGVQRLLVFATVLATQFKSTWFADSVLAVVKAFIQVELILRLGLLANRAALCAGRRLVPWWAHLVGLVAFVKTWLARVLRPPSVKVELGKGLGFTADVAGFRFHRDLAVWA